MDPAGKPLDSVITGTADRGTEDMDTASSRWLRFMGNQESISADSAQFEPTLLSIYSRTQFGSRAFSSLDKASY
jgi:hypothetical protein